MNRISMISTALVLMVGSFALADEPIRSFYPLTTRKLTFAAEPRATSQPTVVKTYPVADLFATDGKHIMSLSSFADLLAKSTGSERWTTPAVANAKPGGPVALNASIVPFHLSFSLIIRGTEADHQAVANRLRLLREFKQLKDGAGREVKEAVKKS